MENVTRVGIDLGKQVFHVTAVDAAGAVVERKRLRRAGLQSYLRRLPRGCVVAMESCGGAHHWARQALWHGHEALLMSPQFVKPYVKSNKNDVADADAIAEASTRPSMRFVGVKSVEQECIQQVHRARQMALKHLTAQRNQLHGFLLEYGIASSKGTGALLRLLPEVLEDGDNELSVACRALLRELGDELRRLQARVEMFDRQLEATARRLKACQRLMTIRKRSADPTFPWMSRLKLDTRLVDRRVCGCRMVIRRVLAARASALAGCYGGERWKSGSGWCRRVSRRHWRCARWRGGTGFRPASCRGDAAGRGATS